VSTVKSSGPLPSQFAVDASTATSLGHLAVHYRPGEGPLAARFFQLLGAKVRSYPRPESDDPFYIIALDSAEPDRADNIVFLFALKPAQLRLESVIAQRLGLGTEAPDPALRAFLDERARLPESYLHVGLHYADLAELERATLRLRAEMADDPAFGARIQGLQVLRARGAAGDDAIDRRMADSPVFGETDTFAYGNNVVQVHIRTDLVSTGLSILGSVIELDHVFTGPGRARNVFNSSFMT